MLTGQRLWHGPCLVLRLCPLQWQGTLSESNEHALIKESTDTIAQHEGKPPLGWLGSGLSESMVSLGGMSHMPALRTHFVCLCVAWHDFNIGRLKLEQAQAQVCKTAAWKVCSCNNLQHLTVMPESCTIGWNILDPVQYDVQHSPEKHPCCEHKHFAKELAISIDGASWLAAFY